jgi:lysophospholipase L1-like esterase
MSARSLALALAICAASFGNAQAGPHWVTAWAAAQQTSRPPAGPVTEIENQTVRMIIHPTLAGRRLRLELSNTYGTNALGVGAVHIALRAKDSAIVRGSDRALTVNGKPSFSIPSGAVVISDPVELDVPRFGDVAVSVYVPGKAALDTQHALALHTTYFSKAGDVTGSDAIADPKTTQAWYWISSLEMEATPDAGTVVAFGDSITEGFRSTPETNTLWPMLVAGRLPKNLAIVNEAISGNQILHDRLGVNALARFDHDVLARPGVKYLVILEGINDIGRGMGPGHTTETDVTTDEVIGGLRQMIERAHTHGIKAIGATLLPFDGAAYHSDSGEVARAAVNQWIRTGGAFDGVIDFDAVIRDPALPNKMRAGLDSGDHLHPNDAGYKAMADAIDPLIFSDKKKR